MKDIYENLQIEVVAFEPEDIIITSLNKFKDGASIDP